MTVEFRVLGPLAVMNGDQAIEIVGPRQRRLLTALVAAGGDSVATDRLVEIVWESAPPATARRIFRTYVRRLRRTLDGAGGDLVRTTTTGYAIDLSRATVDAHEFEVAVDRGRRDRAARPGDAMSELRAALAFWRGDAYGEFASEEWARAEAVRLEELRVGAAETLFDVELEAGLHAEAIADLEAWIEHEPLRESFRRQYLVALFRSGRQADALRAYQDFRRLLDVELGLEPGEELRQLERRVAAGDDDLLRVEPAAHAPRGYQLGEQLGSGAFGIVYRAVQPSVGREVAVKVIRPELADDPEFIRRFETEAQVVARLEHPHVVPLHDYWREPGAAYLVMRLLRGGSLADEANRDVWEPDRLARLASQIGAALAAAHEAGILHGDVKPSNILLDERGDAYLADFGLAEDLATATPASDLSALRAVLTGLAPVGVPLPVASDEEHGTNPYKGLRAFQEADAADFFGRDDLVRRLVDEVGERRFVAVVGPSGSGKSSVVRAGLVPALRAGAHPGSESWFVVTVVPGATPFEELEAALLRVAVNPPPSLIEQLQADERGLARAVKRILADPDGELVIVIDQFEELFTLAEPVTCARFLAVLAEAARDPRSVVRIVATVRADFYDRPLQHPVIGSLVSEGVVSVTPLDGADLEAAVTGPALRRGVAVEPQLVSTVVRDVIDQPGSLPLLQYALTELYVGSDEPRLTLGAYGSVGGVAGALTRRAEEVYAALDRDGRVAARRLFARLIYPGDDTDDTRRRARLADLEDVPESVVETFGAARLLSFDRDPVSREPTVEIGHEVLIRGWPRLRAWVDEDRDGLRTLRHVGDAARAWEASSRDPADLYRGARLAAALDWSATRDPALSSLERQFLDASDAAERERSVARTRQIRRLRGLLVVAAVAIVGLAVVGWVAFGLRGRARDEADRADVRRLAAESVALADTNLDQSLLLGVESAVRSSEPEARGALLGSLLAQPGLRGFVHDVVRVPLEMRIATEGSRLVAITENGAAVQLIDVDSGQPIGEGLDAAELDHGAAEGVAISADGSVAAAQFRDGTVLVLDATTGALIGDPLRHGAVSGSIALSADGRFLAVSGVTDPDLEAKVAAGQQADIDVSAVVFDVSTREQAGPAMPAKNPGLAMMAFNGAADRLAVALGDSSVRVHDIATGEPVGPDIGPHGQPDDLLFSPDGSMLATANGDNAARLWDVATGELVAGPFRHDGFVLRLAFTADDAGLITASADTTVRVWDISSGSVVSRLEAPGAVLGLQVGSDGSVVSTHSDGSLARWQLNAESPLAERLPVPVPARFHPDGTTLATVDPGDPRRVFAFDVVAGAELWKTEPLFEAPPSNAAWNETGDAVAVVSFDGSLVILDAITGEPTGGPIPVSDRGLGFDPDAPPGIAFPVTGLAFSPDGRLIATASASGRVMVWDTETEEPLWPVVELGTLVFDTVFSLETGRLLVATVDGEVIAIDAESGAIDGPIISDPSRRPALALAIEPDRGRLVVTGGDGLVEVWDIDRGERLAAMEGHDLEVRGVTVSADGTIVATTDALGVSRLWDLETGAPIGGAIGGGVTTLREIHPPAITSDGAQLTVFDNLSYVRWDLDVDRWRALACELAGRELTAAEADRFLADGSVEGCRS